MRDCESQHCFCSRLWIRGLEKGHGVSEEHYGTTCLTLLALKSRSIMIDYLPSECDAGMAMDSAHSHTAVSYYPNRCDKGADGG